MQHLDAGEASAAGAGILLNALADCEEEPFPMSPRALRLSPSPRQMTWDLRSTDGDQVRNGIYFIKVAGPGREMQGGLR